MNRLFAFLIIVVLIIAVIGFTRGWFFVTSRTDAADDKVNVGLTVDKAAIRQDTADAKDRAKDLGSAAKKDADQLVDRMEKHAESSKLKASVSVLKLQQGSKSEITVTRGGTELKAEQLGLKPSTGSNLLATGGLFLDGARDTTITIEAPADAHDGTITLSSSAGSETITVSISQVGAPATDPKALVPINSRE